MTQAATGRRAAERLMFDKEAIARAVTAAMYAESPELLAKHGERGREKCLQDMHYNIEHLIPAVDLENGEMFAQYARWLAGMLASRGVSTRDVVRCLELLADEARARFEPDDAALVAGIIDAGLTAVRQPA